MPNLNLKNFAKIADSDFDINDITVFAGKPGTGKSYIMKVLYAIDETPSKLKSEHEYANEKIDYIIKKHGKIQDLKVEKLTPKELNELANLILEMQKLDALKMKADKNFTQVYKNILVSIFDNLNQISSTFSISHENLNLKYSKNILRIEAKDSKNEIMDNVVFVETPLILEFKKFMNREEGKTPYHIESLLKILDKDYSFTDEEQDEFIKSFVSKSKEIIKGSIEDSGDSFIFKTNDKNYDIVNASSGIKSIGLLQYLVTNKALKKGSSLYWEEPEVHLHPTWQLKMVELFIELMNAGVKIVFSTHSPYMADYLNALSKKKELRERISFNLLNETNGVVSNTILDGTNWSQLREELLEPLEEIMWEYL
ncbi:MAG: AAA family ATPase [Sulfuricurvum sp.]|uniref:AAA family ATPase n=1 Tax=Sulfuricurvum sp. TaxID=2025608 RepID=UPI0026297E80|nr:AAA family ATPase [Sulfuricurvum sp.]MDD2369337.1 AAA family ATPase [Sulfuricurvum sp.]MDD5119074.1 AAA family ATPase [Sulfuricurvum sp.]